MNQLRDIFQVYTMTNLIEFENQLEEVFTKILRVWFFVIVSNR
jgi:hypothetical protein